MNSLNCNVQNCGNNYGNMCALSKIKVEGPGACTSGQTCCSSFTEKSAMSNSVSSAVPDTSVSCVAENCKHNRRGKCKSQNISVGNMCASPSVMGETECDTFAAR